MYEKIRLGPKKRWRCDRDVNLNLVSSYRRAYPDDRQDPMRCGRYYDRLRLPETYRQSPASYRPGFKRAPDFARYFSARRTRPGLALLPFSDRRQSGGSP